MKKTPKLRTLIEDEQDIILIKWRHLRLLRRAIKETLIYEGFDRDAEVSVVICDNEAIREINAQYRNIDSATDVLSFPQFDSEEDYPERGYVPIGDIIISAERAENQALIFGHSFERELAFLAVHSTLHLLGYDHVNSKEEELVMREKQRDVMKRLGLEIKDVTREDADANAGADANADSSTEKE